MTPQMFILVIGLVAGAYLFLKYRIAKELQPWRLELAAMGEQLLQAPELDPKDADLVQTQLRMAYSGLGPWVFVIVMPFAAIGFVAMRLLGRRSKPTSTPHALRRELSIVGNRALLSMLANSPIAAILYLMETVLIVILMIPANILYAETARLVGRANDHHHDDGAIHA